MNAHVFIASDIGHDLIHLGEEESHHCIRVLRLREDDQVIVTDGKGTWAHGHIDDPRPRQTAIRLHKIIREYNKRPFHLHIAVAPTKSMDRFETFLEKATECGVDEITPVICAKSERRTVKVHRMQRIVEAAMKQSLRAYMPVLNAPISFADFISRSNGWGRNAFIAHCAGKEKETRLAGLYPRGGNATLMVGPEGDFTGEEIEAALGAGFQAITLGTHRLRTETAAIALCVQANALNGLL